MARVSKLHDEPLVLLVLFVVHNPHFDVVSSFDNTHQPALRSARISFCVGSQPSDHYFRSVCLSVCLGVCLFVCAEFFSTVFHPISIKLGHMLYVWV